MKSVCRLVCLLIGCVLLFSASAVFGGEFVASGSDGADPKVPIRLHYHEGSGKINWHKVKRVHGFDVDPMVTYGIAALYLQEALERMTGREFPIETDGSFGAGLNLTLLEEAPVEFKNDPEVLKALAGNGNEALAANEAFYYRCEPDRVTIIANKPDGLLAGVVALLESVDYEVLGVGPNWTHVPDYRNKPLVFKGDGSGRPSFFVRELVPHSAQQFGMGTILTGLTDPKDESVYESYRRWSIGTRLYGRSIPRFPGHALQLYHKPLLEAMRQSGVGKGFLAKITVGKLSDRPPASEALAGSWWLNSDPKGSPGYHQIAKCDGKTWKDQPASDYLHGGYIDISLPEVRQLVFEAMKRESEAAFDRSPNDHFIMPVEPEDGGMKAEERLKLTADKDWFPKYLKQQNRPFPQPYILNGHHGIDQPLESWDPSIGSDQLFALATWLLSEYDRWIDTLPEEERVTKSGRSKKELVRCSFLSYGWHDVPPNFNPDRRIRISVAPFPKYRGVGKWVTLSEHADVARAMRVMFPDEPVGDYNFYSASFHNDMGTQGIPATRWDPLPSKMVQQYRSLYDAGVRAVTREIDLNFGKCGLGYYLASKLLWNIDLNEVALNGIRDLWFQRAFGTAWQEMKVYYDFMLAENYPGNSPNSWATAIRLIAAADAKLGDHEIAEKRRIDDVKQYWIFAYLMNSGRYTPESIEVKEFLWKGQMSYMVSMNAVLRKYYKSARLQEVVPKEIQSGPAHFTTEEVAARWNEVVEFWKPAEKVSYTETALENGTALTAEDLNDLVLVKEFSGEPLDVPFYYNSGVRQVKERRVMTYAQKDGDPVGFQLFWPAEPGNRDRASKSLPYRAEYWDRSLRTWKLIPQTGEGIKRSEEVVDKDGKGLHLVRVELAAPKAGVYRFSLGTGGNLANLASLAYDAIAKRYNEQNAFTFAGTAEALTQSGIYVYIPRGTRRLDLDVWDRVKKKSVTLHTGLPSDGMQPTRTVDISEFGFHSIAIAPEEAGSFALIEGNQFFSPILYSVPNLWAKAPGALLVPLKVAEADRLGIVGQ